MSFVTTDMVIELCSGMMRRSVWKEILGFEVGEIPVITYADAIRRYGVDNPDTPLRHGTGQTLRLVVERVPRGPGCRREGRHRARPWS